MDMQHVGYAPRIQEARPPYVQFERRAVEQRDAAGNITYIDVDFALITPQGSKDVIEKRMDEYEPRMRQDMKTGQFPKSWYDAYMGAYHAWKHDQAPPVNGTPISNWPAASPAERKILMGVGCVAIEDLAQANEEMMARIGMGARSLKERAKNYMTAATDTAPIVLRLDALEQTNITLEHNNRLLEEQNRMLRMQVEQRVQLVGQAPIQRESLEDRLSSARSAADASGPSDGQLIDDVIREEL